MKICHFLLLISKKLVCFRSKTLGEPENPDKQKHSGFGYWKRKTSDQKPASWSISETELRKAAAKSPVSSVKLLSSQEAIHKTTFFPPVSVPALKYRFSFSNGVYGQPDLKTLYYGNPEADRGSKQFASYPEDRGHWEASQLPASPRSQHARA